MRLRMIVARLVASGMLACVSGGAIAAPVEDTLKQIQTQIDALKKQGTYTVNQGSLAIESWLLASTALESTATKIGQAVSKDVGASPVLVIAGTDQLDFG